MHDEACFLYARNGTSNLYGSQGEIRLHSKEGVLMKCGNYLNNWIKQDPEDEYDAVAVHFYPEVLKEVYQNELPSFMKDSDKKAVAPPVVSGKGMIDHFVDNLVFYFDNPTLVTDDLIRLKVKEIILLLIRTEDSERVKNILSSLFSPDTYDFQSIINNNLYTSLSMDDLALLTNTSLSTFKRRFKQCFGEAPAQYIKKKKLEKASHLLRNSSNRITDIALEVGFENAAHFTKVFGQTYGASPSEYRKTTQ